MDYYIPDRFRDRVALHIAKNFVELPKVQPALILGVHGAKGEGKSFMVERILEEMRALTIHIAAGELESPDAGEPGRMIRVRYLEAAELVQVRGKVAVLVIHDIDAGAGRWAGATQYTVNTQIVTATLMAIADNPTRVQLPGSYSSEPTARVPIIVTGNDFSTLYAPLTRDGRMTKFLWQPATEERREIVRQLFSEDRIAQAEVDRLVAHFPDRPVDFFGAIRSRLYDDQLLSQLKNWGLENINLKLVNNDGKPPVFDPPRLTLDLLVHWGEQIEQEQSAIDSGLSSEYMGLNHSSRQEQPRQESNSGQNSNRGASRSLEYGYDRPRFGER
ncbi:AAA family ATPase [Leptolyngbya sp. FACHB-261]|uniref:AAA family ATPase n=1 Tax=Leptolyngbya sp. FACHB-261 TaxID=2692806 RepID=UPI00168529AF|nr:AAA family ATPase [Leptolyngbya sp. FACHB-261]MBD2099636.1 AAA family ATPase [Leptolyngbya sp. FACHB-261]